jgi:molecular chaperone DnaJ
MARMPADYYAALGVDPEASSEDIKRAFRALAREYHPDATGGDAGAEHRYKEISEAYAVLSDPHKRREYDAARMGVGGFAGFGSAIEDIFDTFFGGQVRAQQRGRARRGESIEVVVELELREVVFGSTRTLRFERHEPCDRCGGDGCEPGSHPARCEQCGGTGQVEHARRTILGSMVTAYPCAACSGTGSRVENPCSDCRATGRTAKAVELPLEVPAGIDQGDRLQLRGQGEAGIAGGPRGDLFVRFAVEPDDRFDRVGDDLATEAQIPMTTAALGGVLRFESLDGDEELKIVAGTQPGSVFRIRGRGVARRGGRGRGDLVVRVQVHVPTELDAEQEQLVRTLADLRGEEASEGRGFLKALRRALGGEAT